MANVGGIVISVLADASPFSRDINRVKAKLPGMGLKMGTALGAGILAGVTAALGRQGIEDALSLERIQQQFKNVFKDSALATSQFEQFAKVATETGIGIEANASTFARLSEAFQQQGLSLEVIQDTFKGVASAAATFNMRADDVNGILLAFQQVASKGKVSAEELRQQIGERIPGALAIAQRELGVTSQELNRMLERGELLANDFLPKFARGLNETFGQNLPEKTDTLAASFTRLKNELFLLSAAFAEQSGLAPATKEATQGMSGLLAATREFFDLVNKQQVKGASTLGETTMEEVFKAGEELRRINQLVEHGNIAPKVGQFRADELFAKFPERAKEAIKAHVEVLKAEERIKALSQTILGFQEDFQKVSNDPKKAEIFTRGITRAVEKLGTLRDQTLPSLREEFNRTFFGIQNTANDAAEGLEKIEKFFAQGTPLHLLAPEGMPNSVMMTDEQLEANQQALDEEAKQQAAHQKKIDAMIFASIRRELERKKQMQEELKRGYEAVNRSFARGMTNAIVTGEFDFNDMLKRLATRLLESALFNILTQLFNPQTMGGGGQAGGILSFASLFAGAFATGGTIPSGRWGIVGEQSPEIITASSSPISVTPLPPMSGGAGGSGGTTQVVNNITFTTDVKRSVKEEVNSMIPKITEVTTSSVREAQLRNRPY